MQAELQNIQKSLSSGEQEKVELVKSLACLKDDLTRLQVCDKVQSVFKRVSVTELLVVQLSFFTAYIIFIRSFLVQAPID